jgi:predicted Fe-S protein YdhL (DUF1289 family)
LAIRSPCDASCPKSRNDICNGCHLTYAMLTPLG